MKTAAPPAKGDGPVNGFAEEAGEGSSVPKPYLGYAFAATAANSRCVIVMHGGSWAGNAFTAEEMEKGESIASNCERMRNEGNSFVFAINYPESQGPIERIEHPYNRAMPYQSNIIEKAVAWCETHATEYNGDPSKICLVGFSSGGHVVAYAAEAINALAKTTRIKLAITLSGPMDLTKTIQTGENLAIPTAQAIGVPQATCNEPEQIVVEKSWSPVEQVNSFCPPYVLFGSTAEAIVPVVNQTLMQERLEAKSIPVSRFEPPTGHSIAYWGAKVKGKLVGEGGETTLRVYEWVCRALNKI